MERFQESNPIQNNMFTFKSTFASNVHLAVNGKISIMENIHRDSQQSFLKGSVRTFDLFAAKANELDEFFSCIRKDHS